MDDKETRCNDIVDRLRGVYRTKVNDGAGLLDGKDTFTREFPKHLIPPIQAEAADEIERLREVNGIWITKASELDVLAKRLQSDAETLRAERDALMGLLVVESIARGSGWIVLNDLKTKITGRYPTREDAVNVVRKAAGLDPIPGPAGAST